MSRNTGKPGPGFLEVSAHFFEFIAAKKALSYNGGTKKRTVHFNWGRVLFMMEKSYDVLVAGGGVSGVCAAISAARAGRKTALIQNRPVLGGNSSSEIRVWTRGAVGGGSIYGEEMGVLGELKLYNLYRNPEASPVFWDEVLLDRVLAEDNLDLYLNTHIYETICDENGNVESLKAFMLGSEAEYLFSGKMVVDATGDGTVGVQAKVPYRVGREEKSRYGESLGVEKADGYVLGSSIFFQALREKSPVRFVKPDYAYGIDKIEEILKKGGGRIANETMNGCDYWWIEYGGEADTIGDNQEICLELKRIVMGLWNYIKNSGKFKADNLTLEWIGNLPGKRESRRFCGEYTLTQKDIEEGKKFADAAAYGGWYMDFHPSGGIYSEEEFCTQIPVFAYDIPLRCLYNRTCGNLLFAGRNISVSHAAFSSTRIMDTCGLAGQAAGETAAFCIEKGISVRELDQQRYTEEIRQRLLKNDGGLLGAVNRDGEDHAQKAAVLESGHRKVRKAEAAAVTGYVPLEKDRFVIGPGMGQAEQIGLAVRCTEDTEVSWHIYKSSLPNRFLRGTHVLDGKSEVKKGQEELLFSLAGIDSGYGKIVFEENPAVELAVTDEPLTGFLTGQESSPVYETPCVTEYGDIYSCEAVTNGYNRPYENANLWISGRMDEEQYLKFTWEEPVEVSQIRITFNPGLDKELPSSVNNSGNPHHGFAKRDGAAKELVKDFDIFVLEDGEEKKAAEIRDNYLRLCVVDIPKIKTEAVKIVFRKTWGSDRAEVFEVRIYQS